MDVAITAAVSGIDAASTWMDATAGNVANADTPGYQPVVTTMSAAPPPSAGVVATTAAAPAPAQDTLATQLPDSLFAAMMAKADVVVMTKVIQAYQQAMKDFDGDGT